MSDVAGGGGARESDDNRPRRPDPRHRAADDLRRRDRRGGAAPLHPLGRAPGPRRARDQRRHRRGPAPDPRREGPRPADRGRRDRPAARGRRRRAVPTQAVAQARDYAEAGASALLVFPIPAYLSPPLDPAIPVEYHRAIADGRPAADRVPAAADARRRQLRLRHAAAADRPRRRGGDEGGVVRRPPLPGHVPDGRADAEVPGRRVHLPDRQRQLHPRVVHARLHRGADRLRRDHGHRAGRDDRGLAATAGSTRRARSASACSGSPTWSSTRRSPTTAPA